jgi:hypothetical protein
MSRKFLIITRVMIGCNLGFYDEILMAGIIFCQGQVNVYYNNYWVDLRTVIGVPTQINDPGL